MTQMPINSPSLPGIRQPLLEGTSASRPYYLFLQWVATNLSSLSATVADLSAQQGGISISPDANVTGQNSIKTRGTLAEGIVQVSLQGDVSVAGNTQYYGSDQTGNKGWYAVSSALAGSSNISLSTAVNGVTTFDLTDVADSGAGSLLAITRDSKGRITGTRAATITGTAARVTVTNGDASAGLPIIDLAPLADAGGGALLRFVRDAWGRITGTSSATTDDLTEGSSNLYFTAARVLGTLLTGLSLATSAVIAATDSVLGALGKLQAQITNNLLPPDYIDGLKMVWVSATAVTVTTGAAYIPGLSKVLRVTVNIAKTGLALSAATQYHLYLYNNSGTPDIEFSTTAPDAPYNGIARTKTGDASRRYVGSILTAGANVVDSFTHSLEHGRVDYRISNQAGALLVLANGRATSATNVSLASVVPPTATHAVMFGYNDPSTSQTVFYAASDGPVVPSGGLEGFVAAGAQISALIRLDANQAFSYAYAGTVSGAAGFTVRISGYTFER